MSLLLWSSLALAGDTSIGFFAAGEAAFGEALNDHFRGTSLGGELYTSFPLPLQLEGKVSVGYRRLTGIDTADEFLWYSPVSATVGFAIPAGRASLFADLGPSYVLWGGTPSTVEGIGSSGGNLGMLIEGGARYPTMLLQPSLHHPDAKIGGLDVVGSVGLRWSYTRRNIDNPDELAFDFSALRLNLGVAARF